MFATVPDGVADRLRESFRFYDWDAAKNEVRWMCSFDTTEADIDAFVAALARRLTAAVLSERRAATETKRRELSPTVGCVVALRLAHDRVERGRGGVLLGVLVGRLV